MIVVTGGAGFIGSNLIKALNRNGISNILVIDDLTDGHKFANIADCDILDYMDKDEFLKKLLSPKDEFGFIKAVFHLGACSTTTEWDGKYMMENNYFFSKVVFHDCLERKIPFIYASSAAVYGNGQIFKEERSFEKPINVYGYSKFLFDQHVRPFLSKNGNQIVGLRYFNVYGPNESHKGSMASVFYHFDQQIKKDGVCKLFEGTDGYENGEQLRDFVFVEDVIDVNLWFLNNPSKSGIFNVGTGRAQSFNDAANAIIRKHGKGKIKYIPFPEHLKGAYQSYTQADISKLREAGYDKPFKTVEEAVQSFV